MRASTAAVAAAQSATGRQGVRVERRATGAAVVKLVRVDRAVLLVALVAAGVLIALGAYFVLGEYVRPAFVNGPATAERIDTEVGHIVAARFPNITVGAARCPRVLNLTGDARGRCALPVGDTELHFDLVKMSDTGDAELQGVDALFVATYAERVLAAQLAERYGEPFDVRCPGAPVRVLDRGEKLACSVEAPDVPRRGDEVTVSGHDGAAYANELAGVTTRAVRILGADVATRTEGSIEVDGHAMERYVRGSASADFHGEVGRRRLVGAARCPSPIVLREGGRTTCTVRVGGLPLRYDVTFEKGPGLAVTAGKKIEVIAVLREIAARFFERPVYTGGKPLLATIDCGKAAVAFIEPGSIIPCTAKVGENEYGFAFRFTDASESFSLVGN